MTKPPSPPSRRPTWRPAVARDATREPPADAGSGSVLVLAVLLVAATGLVTAAWLAAALHARAGLRTAADLAALAAAERSYLLVAGPGECPEQVREQARAVAEANRARLTGCRTDSALAVVVTVAPQGATVRGSPASAQARAGICHLPSAGEAPPDGPEPGSVECHSSSARWAGSDR